MSAKAPARPLVPIPADRLPGMIGCVMHVQGYHPGCVWVLDRIEGEWMHMHTPKTRKPFRALASRACYARKHEPQP